MRMVSLKNPLASLILGAASPREFAGEPSKKVNFILHTLSITYKKLLSLFITLYHSFSLSRKVSCKSINFASYQGGLKTIFNFQFSIFNSK